mmetsp:Transcript_24199/g.27575  ORF Transcript_24199/g.27575 Transcript_24199/m.27575 type:complete len:87 (+) Transcript_24199:41-301(+)
MKITLFAIFSFIASSAVMGSSSVESDALIKLDKELNELQDLVDQVNENELENCWTYQGSPCLTDSNCCGSMKCVTITWFPLAYACL